MFKSIRSFHDVLPLLGFSPDYTDGGKTSVNPEYITTMALPLFSLGQAVLAQADNIAPFARSA